jgi:hypothetical protein
MRPCFFRASPFLVAIAVVFSSILARPVAAQDDGPERSVVFRYVEGDVRLSRGGEVGQPDLNGKWEKAGTGMEVWGGTSIATGAGRAIVDFEDGSSVYLADHSLLLFHIVGFNLAAEFTVMELMTGTASVDLRPIPHEEYAVWMPVNSLHVKYPQAILTRIDSFLYTTVLTPQLDTKLALAGIGSEDVEDDLEAVSGEATAFASYGPIPLTQVAPYTIPTDWDEWVAARVVARRAEIRGALDATGLPYPVGDLLNLYETGIFTPCEPDAVCWDPIEAANLDSGSQPELDIEQTSNIPASLDAAFAERVDAQVPNGLASAVPGIEPLTASIRAEGTAAKQAVAGTAGLIVQTPRRRSLVGADWSGFPCPQIWDRDLAKLLGVNPALSYPDLRRCLAGYYIKFPGERYRRVVRPPHGRTVHLPHGHWVKVAGKSGFVPSHPRDLPGKPPLNLKAGIIVPATHPGERTAVFSYRSTANVFELRDLPKGFRKDVLAQTKSQQVQRPEIEARLGMPISSRQKGVPEPSQGMRVTYSYRDWNFVVRTNGPTGATAKSAPVSYMNLQSGFLPHSPASAAIYGIASAGEMRLANLYAAAEGSGRGQRGGGFFSGGHAGTRSGGGEGNWHPAGGTSHGGGWSGGGGGSHGGGGSSSSGGGGSRGGGGGWSGGGSAGGGGVSHGGGGSTGGGSSGGSSSGGGGGGGGHAH